MTNLSVVKNEKEINVEKLGYNFDEWGELIENNGEKANEVREEVINLLVYRNMPQVQIRKVFAKVSLLSEEKRPYTITTTHPGATTAIYVTEYGKDLYASWRAFIKPTINFKLIFIYLLSAFGLAVLVNFIFVLQGWNQAISAYDKFHGWKEYSSIFGELLLFSFGIIFVVSIIILELDLGSKILTKKRFIFLILISTGIALFIKNIGSRLISQTIIIFKYFRTGFRISTLSWNQLFIVSFSFFGLILLGALLIGIINRKGGLAYFINYPSYFEVDDIKAMNMSVHKSVLRALDLTGIDISNLRLKSGFKGAMRTEEQ